MSTFRAEVVPVSLLPHPNADSLSLVRVFDYTVIVRTEDWAGKDKGVYIPVDSIVPDAPEFSWLDNKRIKAKKIRGVFSQGILTPCGDALEIGDDVTDLIGITKHEEPVKYSNYGDAVSPPPLDLLYTDIESLLRYSYTMNPDEYVYVTEKIQGANMRVTYQDNQMYVGSHKMWRKREDGNLWWEVMDDDIRRFVVDHKVILFGEVYGKVQDLRYGLENKAAFRAFDVLDLSSLQYYNYDMFLNEMSKAEILVAPTLYMGPYNVEELKEVAERDSTLKNGQLMEGIVVRPEFERWNAVTGRTILKLHSQRYLLRKEA